MDNAEIVDVPLQNLKDNKNNPRQIKSHKLNRLLVSVMSFPKMLRIRPIVIDNDNVVLGGNQRYKCLKIISGLDDFDISQKLSKSQEYGYDVDAESMSRYWVDWKKNPLVPVIIAGGLTKDEQHKFIAADNANAGEWDWNKLFDGWDEKFLECLGIDTPEKKDEFEKKFNSYNDSNCLYPLVPKFDEKHELFIVISDSEVDSNNLREKLGMNKMESYKRGKFSKSNVISIKDVLRNL